MLTFLSKLLIKDSENTTSPVVRQAYGVLCGSVGIVLNILLFFGKFFAGTLSHSISITADAFNNLSDAGSSIITLIGFRMSGSKPDPDHPFGHGRIEYLSGLFVSLAILMMAIELIKSSIKKILHPEAIEFNYLIIIILLISIFVKCYMAYFNKKIGKKINSAAMNATATDSLSDTIATTAVLLTTLFVHFTNINIDGYCGILVGILIFYAGISAVRDTINPLLGQAPEPEFVRQIEQIVMHYDGVLGVHDLIVHNYGPGRLMISLHAEVPASGNILKLHDMIDLIEHQLQKELHCDAVIHMDPIMNDDPETMQLQQDVKNIIHSIDATLTIHDFRIVKGPTHTNLIFDMVVPFTYVLTDAELRERIDSSIKKINPNYFTVIDIDKNYNESLPSI